MDTRPQRAVQMSANFVTWVALFALFILVGSTNRADEIDDKFNEVNQRLLDTQIDAVEKSLKSIRELLADLVKNGDPRTTHVQAREQELSLQLRNLEQQKGTDAQPVDLRKLEKEFEAIDDRGGWWWLEAKNPDKKGPWYRLKTAVNRFEHNYEDAKGRRQIAQTYSGTYEILGLENGDENVILIKICFPRKGDEPGDENVMRFNRTTGVLATDFGWYGEPKGGSK